MTPEELFWWRCWRALACCRLQISNLFLKLSNAVLRFKQRRLDRRILRLERDILSLQAGQPRKHRISYSPSFLSTRSHRPAPIVGPPSNVNASDRHSSCLEYGGQRVRFKSQNHPAVAGAAFRTHSRHNGELPKRIDGRAHCP